MNTAGLTEWLSPGFFWLLLALTAATWAAVLLGRFLRSGPDEEPTAPNAWCLLDGHQYRATGLAYVQCRQCGAVEWTEEAS